jgi:type IV pilus assembly protein PilB
MRLVEMGMEPYLVTSALTAALAQRLARRLCVHCREPYQPTEADIVAAGWSPEEVFSSGSEPVLYRAVGCSACSTTGYLGRKALLELLVITESIEHTIIEGGTADDIHRLAVAEGMVTLRQSGLQRALEGDTTLEEVLRVVA